MLAADFTLRDVCEEARDRRFANGGFPRNFRFEEIPLEEESENSNCEFIDHNWEFVEDEDVPRKSRRVNVVKGKPAERRYGNCTVIDHEFEFVN